MEDERFKNIWGAQISLDVCFTKRNYRVGGQGDDDQTMLREKLQTPKGQKIPWPVLFGTIVNFLTH